MIALNRSTPTGALLESGPNDPFSFARMIEGSYISLEVTNIRSSGNEEEEQRFSPVSIVVSNHNGLRLGVLGNCLRSILRIRYPNYEVIIIDNDSSDGSTEYIKEHFSDTSVRIVSNGKNNYSAGLNMGFGKSIGDYVLYLNNDIEVEPDFVGPLVDSIKAERVGIVQCKLLDSRATHRIDSLGEEIGFLGYHRSLWSGQLESEGPKIPFEIPCTNGSAFMARRELLHELGGFDERYYSGYEDVNLSLSAKALGYRIISDPRSQVLHSRGTTALSVQLRAWTAFHFAKNRLTTLLKFHKSHNLFFVLNAVALAYFLEFIWLTTRKREVKAGIAKLRALLWVWRNMGYVVRERKKIWSIRRNRDFEIKPWIFPF